MDQKRILWIVAASGIFLLVVVGVAMFLSAPQIQTQQTLASLQGTGNTWIKGEVKNPEFNVPNTDNPNNSDTIISIDEKTVTTQPNSENQTINVDTVTLIAGTTNVYTQGKDSSNVETFTNNEKQTGTQETSTTITVNTVPKGQPKTQNVTVTSVSPKTSQTSKTADCVEEPKEVVSNKSSSTTNTNNQKASSTTSTVESKQIADQYWVQVASFTSKKNAEDARAALLVEKINSEIFTYKDSKGVVYYRLRVGPYTTKSEAEYWHSRIKLIDQFVGTSSYVVNSTGKAQN